MSCAPLKLQIWLFLPRTFIGSFFRGAGSNKVQSQNSGFKNKLGNCYFFVIRLWKVRVLAEQSGRGDAGPWSPHSFSSQLLLIIILGWRLLAYVAEVRMWVGFRGEGLLAAPTGWQKLSFLWVPPLHPPVLEPDLYLGSGRGRWVGKVVPCVNYALRPWYEMESYLRVF